MKTPWLGEKVRLGMLNQTAGQGLIDDSEGCGKIVPQWYHAYPVRCLMLCNLVKQIVVRKKDYNASNCSRGIERWALYIEVVYVSVYGRLHIL